MNFLLKFKFNRQPCNLIAVGCFLLQSVSPQISAQSSLPYLIATASPHLELLGLPVHQPALDSGAVQSVNGPLIYWTPGFLEKPLGTALLTAQEFYAEVIGPANHLWLGHRLELDEAATRARTDHSLVIAASPYNTRGLPNATLAGARLEVRSHLTVDGLWGETVRNRIVYGGEPAAGFRFSLAAPGTPSGTRSVTASLPRPTNALEWIDSFAPGTRITQPLLIPPGTAVAVTFGQRRGSSLGLTAESRSWPTAAPLQAGANLLSYPYPKDMKLGVDWGSSREGFRGSSRPSPSMDRIEILSGTSRQIFGPEAQPNSAIRWRRLDPFFTGARWATPPGYLETIPVGEGFILRKAKADPHHFFYPPKP
jgi:hypothetical protein